jgi:PAS domain S-box-containing protein
VWASLNVSVVRDAAGAPLHVISQVEDISERRRANEELRESESKFRTLTETIGTAVCIFQGPAILYVNPAASRITGYTQDEMLAMNFWDVIHPDSRDLMRQRGLARQRGDAVPAEDEVMILRKSGEVRWVDFAAASIEFDGRPAVLGTAVDITERKHAAIALETRVAQRTAELSETNRSLRDEIAHRSEAEAALRDSEERFRAIFDQAAVGVSQMGADGRYVLVNQRMCDILGYSREELLERSFRDVTYPDDVEASVRSMRGVQANETGSFNLEKRYIRKDGSVIWVNLTASAVRDVAGNVKYGIGIVEDISERKRAEEELGKTNRRIRAILEEISDGFYTLDHDGRFSYLNPSALRLFERSADQLLGKTFRETFPEAAGTPFYDQYDRLMTDRLRVDIEAYYAPRNRWFRVRGYPTQRRASVMF